MEKNIFLDEESDEDEEAYVVKSELDINDDDIEDDKVYICRDQEEYENNGNYYEGPSSVPQQLTSSDNETFATADEEETKTVHTKFRKIPHVPVKQNQHHEKRHMKILMDAGTQTPIAEVQALRMEVNALAKNAKVYSYLLKERDAKITKLARSLKVAENKIKELEHQLNNLLTNTKRNGEALNINNFQSTKDVIPNSILASEKPKTETETLKRNCYKDNEERIIKKKGLKIWQKVKLSIPEEDYEKNSYEFPSISKTSDANDDKGSSSEVEIIEIKPMFMSGMTKRKFKHIK